MGIPNKLKETVKNYVFTIPEELKKNMIYLPDDAMKRIEDSVRKNFHKGWRAEETFTPEDYKEDLGDHIINRLEHDRQRIIPWLNDAMPLKGKKILEIGCGTGASAISLAEQGAIVTGVDLDEDALIVARDRVKEYNLDVKIVHENAVNVHERFKDEDFDFVIFFATIEHMTHEERMLGLKSTWEMLKPGAMWVVLETPNRLWYYDNHTSHLPFFQWLPDDLAFKYAHKSPRKDLAGSVKEEYNDENLLHFLRLGRGLSYHEFDLCMGDAKKLNVVSSKVQFEKYEWLKTSKLDKRFKDFIKEAYPGLHDGFYDKSFDLIIKK